MNVCCISFDSYIKPQRTWRSRSSDLGCISFDSYIKPQPTSGWISILVVVYLLIPTSNHNGNAVRQAARPVVYLLIPTSNHNAQKGFIESQTLYIFWFLHQTTTVNSLLPIFMSCISFDSYIKPQRVRYTVIPSACCISFDSYIKPQLV